ncbi:aminomethyltransferase family protein, partial [Cribrihabitans sp. XS_ASV171]
KYRVHGPGALAALNRMVTRNLERVGNGRVAYVVWCDETGMVIDDGTLYRSSATDFRLCSQEPMFGWLRDAVWGCDAEVEDLSDEVAALSLQGPTTWSVLASADFDVADLRPFDWREVEQGLWISRTGFTGDLGYEIWMPRDRALEIWDRLWMAGLPLGLRAIGSEALEIARIEAGFIAARVDFQPALTAERLHRGKTPFELGLSRFVDWDKGHFNGRRALLAQRRDGPRTRLVRLDIGGHRPARDAFLYDRWRREIGHVTSAIWSPTAKRNVALAHVNARVAARRDIGLRAEIDVNEEGRWERRRVPVRMVEAPFFTHPRARATPPERF